MVDAPVGRTIMGSMIHDSSVSLNGGRRPEDLKKRVAFQGAKRKRKRESAPGRRVKPSGPPVVHYPKGPARRIGVHRQRAKGVRRRAKPPGGNFPFQNQISGKERGFLKPRLPPHGFQITGRATNRPGASPAAPWPRARHGPHPPRCGVAFPPANSPHAKAPRKKEEQNTHPRVKAGQP